MFGFPNEHKLCDRSPLIPRGVSAHGTHGVHRWMHLKPSPIKLEKLDTHMQKNETGSFSYTVHKHTKISSKFKPKWTKNLNLKP